MNNINIKKFLAVFMKDIRSEFRTRYSISAITLFILTTIVMIAFSITSTKVNAELTAGLLWVILFFGAMTGLSKSFVSEEERQTSFLLKITSNSASVYFGKLFFNIVLCLTLNIVSVMLFFLFIGYVGISSFGVFAMSILLGSLGIASGTTIISAIIARANTKGALFPVLSFPILLPLIILGIELTKASFEGVSFANAQNNLMLIIAYCGILITVSYLFFDYVWED